MEQEQGRLSIDERIANLKTIILMAEYELSILLKQKEYRPVWFIISQKKEWQTKKKKQK